MYPNDLSYEAQALEQRTKSGARWFFWIAALSVGTSLIAFPAAAWRFFLSLASLSSLMAWQKAFRQTWRFRQDHRTHPEHPGRRSFCADRMAGVKTPSLEFRVGMVLFALDALLLLAFQVWISFVFMLGYL